MHHEYTFLFLFKGTREHKGTWGQTSRKLMFFTRSLDLGTWGTTELPIRVPADSWGFLGTAWEPLRKPYRGPKETLYMLPERPLEAPRSPISCECSLKAGLASSFSRPEGKGSVFKEPLVAIETNEILAGAIRKCFDLVSTSP